MSEWDIDDAIKETKMQRFFQGYKGSHGGPVCVLCARPVQRYRDQRDDSGNMIEEYERYCSSCFTIQMRKSSKEGCDK